MNGAAIHKGLIRPSTSPVFHIFSSSLAGGLAVLVVGPLTETMASPNVGRRVFRGADSETGPHNSGERIRYIPYLTDVSC